MKWKKIISREYSVQYCELALQAISSQALAYLPLVMKQPVVLTESGNQVFYFEMEEEKQFVEAIVKQFCVDHRACLRYVKHVEKLGQDFVEFCKTISCTDLLETYQAYQKRSLEFTSLSIWAGFLLTNYWTDKVSALIQSAEQDVRKALFSPLKQGAVFVMKEEAAKMACTEKNMKRFLETYQWLPCLDIQCEPWSMRDAEACVKDTGVVPETERMSFEEAATRAQLTKSDRRLFVMIRNLGYLKDLRDEHRRKAMFYARSLFREIARDMGMPVNDVAYLTENEIAAFLKGEQVDVSTAKKRQKGFMMYLENGSVQCITSNIQRELKRRGFQPVNDTSDKIKGTVASAGKAIATVVIVTTLSDIRNVRKGDVIVAVSTHPDYITAMEKASGIITDEGGISSHAAIISRELGIPCIVGTGNATKMLNDGQVVEIDGETGCVRKLN